MYKYYSTERPVSIGTYPKPKDNKPVNIENFDLKTYVPEIKAEAYGYLEYEQPLTSKQVATYELKEPKTYEARPKFNRTSHKWNIVINYYDEEIKLGHEENGFVKYSEFDTKADAIKYIENKEGLQLKS